VNETKRNYTDPKEETSKSGVKILEDGSGRFKKFGEPGVEA